MENNYKYINSDTYECVLACPSNLKKLEFLVKINDIDVYLCKSSCELDEYRLEDKCVEKCPEGYNYLGNNNICKLENCNGDPNGQYYYQYDTLTKEDSTTYPLYKCINSCQDTQDLTQPYLHYEESNPYHCLDSCPPQKFILGTKCVPQCPDTFPFYNIDDNTNSYYYKCHNENFCSSNNNGDIYFLDGTCTTINNCISSGKKFIDNKNMCMDKCREDEYNEVAGDGSILCKKDCEKYKYQENIESVLECVQDCPQGKPFIGKNK